MVLNLEAKTEELTRAEMELATEKVLEASSFSRNPTASRFLRFIVDESLAGRGDRLKAFTIATLALGRSTDFDPQTDSTVRVQALRLRQLLEEYYSGPGSLDPWRIEIPRGAYQPRFSRVAMSSTPDLAVTAAPATPFPGPLRKFGARGLAIIFLLLLFFAALGLAVWTSDRPAGARSGTEIDGPPKLLVLAPEFVGSFPREGALPRRALATIEHGLDTMDYVVVRSSGSVASSGDVDYVLHSRFWPGVEDRFDAELRLTRAGSAEAIWSRRFDDVKGADVHEVDAVARKSVASIADIGGVIFSDLRARLPLSSGPPRSLTCRLTALDYLRNRNTSEKARSRDCLETLIAAEPDNASLLRLLSTLLLFDYLDGVDGEGAGRDLERALLLARRAYDLTPLQVNAQAALFFARFFDGRYDDAFQLAREALANGSSSVLIAVRAGRIYVSRGLYAEGDALLRQAEDMNGAPLATSSAYLALSAFAVGNEAALDALAEEAAMNNSALGVMLKLIDFSRRGDHSRATASADRLKAAFPGFANDVPAALDRYGVIASLKASLLHSLEQTPEYAGIHR